MLARIARKTRAARAKAPAPRDYFATLLVETVATDCQHCLDTLTRIALTVATGERFASPDDFRDLDAALAGSAVRAADTGDPILPRVHEAAAYVRAYGIEVYGRDVTAAA